MADVREERIVKTEEILAGKTGEQMPEESPLEEARRLNEENKKLSQQIKEQTEKLEKLNANLMIGGRTMAGQKVEVKSDLEQARERGKETAEKYLGKKK